MRHKHFLVIVTGVAVCMSACSITSHKKGNKQAGVWPEQAVVVDGINHEWHKPLGHYDEKAMLGYAVTNDSENLYITVETGDAATQMKILENGLTVWIDKMGKETQTTAINYPIPAAYKGKQVKDGAYTRVHAEQDAGPAEAIQKRLLDMRMNIKQAIAEADEYSLQGFKGCNLQFPVKAQNSCGIEVRINMDEDNELIWEAKIPFRAFYFKNKVDRADRNRQMSVCIETTGSKRPEGQPTARNIRARNAGGFRPGLSVGGMGMGVSFGGGNAGGGGSNAYDPNLTLLEPLYKTTKTWVKTGIAVR